MRIIKQFFGYVKDELVYNWIFWEKDGSYLLDINGKREQISSLSSGIYSFYTEIENFLKYYDPVFIKITGVKEEKND